jgi:hypothetical protein
MVYSILRLGVISAVISLAFGQLVDNNEPTHIIKFKTSVTRTAGKKREKKNVEFKLYYKNLTYCSILILANNMLLAHHRDFLSSVRSNVIQMSNNTGFSAAAVEQEMSLDHINIGPDFVAVAGIFSDHAFLEYLYQQNAIDYVEQNQIYKTTAIVPTAKEEPVAYDILEKKIQEVDIDEEVDMPITKEDVSTLRSVKTSKPANWGLARINQHQKGGFNEYEFDTYGG